MPGKIITTASGRKMHVGGRVRPKGLHLPRLSFRHMRNAGVLPLVVAPASTSYGILAATGLADPLGNLRVGDCVEVSGLHANEVTSANSGAPIVYTEAQALAQYGQIGGYDPSQTQPDGSNPTDCGLDEHTALNWFVANGFPDGTKPIAWVDVDATSETDWRDAIYLFENAIACLELPDEIVNNLPDASGFTWDISGPPNPDNGHSVDLFDNDPLGAKVATWGLEGLLTTQAIAYYCSPANGGSLSCMLIPDVVNRLTQKSPAGYSIAPLIQYLAFVAANS